MTWAEDALKAWAAKRLEVPVETVESVRFEHEPAYAYSSWTWEPESDNAYVKIIGERHERTIGGCGAEDIPRILQEALEAYLPPEAQAVLP